MWCPHCQAETPADVNDEGSRLQCVHCGTEVGFPNPSGTEPEAGGTASRPVTDGRSRDARELLARWSNLDPLDPFGPVAGSKKDVPRESHASRRASAAEQPNASTAEQSTKSVKKNALQFRLDGAHTSRTQAAGQSTQSAESDLPREAAAEAIDEMASQQSQLDRESRAVREAEGQSGQRDFWRTDQAQPISGWHAAPSTRPQHSNHEAPASNWMQMAGQLTAYAGVLGLTVGTAIVLWGYFGGPIELTPTGWLVATVGQMLLFLGVVTLVSGGMEQTTAEVSRRVETLGDRMLRIEHATREHLLRGPHFPVSSAGLADGDRGDSQDVRPQARPSRGESVGT